MTRFIMLTFGFLGLAFYEMSGGADFEPAQLKTMKVNPLLPSAVATAADDAETPGTKLASNALVRNDATPISGGAGITPVALNLTKARAVKDNAIIGGEANDMVQKASFTTRRVISSADTPAIITRQTDARAEGEVTLKSAVAMRPEFETRVVSGSRVNVRGGPGINFGIVDQLNRGEKVEVIRDNGNGWIKLRSADGRIGWMADFLLAAR